MRVLFIILSSLCSLLCIYYLFEMFFIFIIFFNITRSLQLLFHCCGIARFVDNSGLWALPALIIRLTPSARYIMPNFLPCAVLDIIDRRLSSSSPFSSFTNNGWMGFNVMGLKRNAIGIPTQRNNDIAHWVSS
jgi:hypothetical protein